VGIRNSVEVTVGKLAEIDAGEKAVKEVDFRQARE